jgi:translation initiation factor 2 subunit 2
VKTDETPKVRFEEGAVLDLEIQMLSRRGDGMIREGKYTVYIPGAKPGQKLKVRISRVAGSTVFGEIAQ